jgi:hypothetical protein
MTPEDRQIDAIADAVRRYLDQHPDAADTVDGIAKWWLPAPWCADAESVQSALVRLEAQGAVSRRTLGDRHVLYSRTGASDRSI